MVCFLAVVEIVILTFGLVLGTNNDVGPQPRIVNGDLANHADYPWFAVGLGCGATLIHPDILISAAHCQGVFDNGLIMISEDRQEFNRYVQIDLQIRNNNYNEYSPVYVYKSDIMLLRLSEPIFDVTPLVWNIDESIPVLDEILTVIGYGRTATGANSSDVLLKGDMVYIDNDMCRTLVEGFFETFPDLPPGIDPADEASFTIDDGILCTSRIEDIEASFCMGDSGGPLFTQDDPPLLVGIVSYLLQDCESLTPNMFTRVSKFDGWIRKRICEWSVITPNYCDEYPPDPVPDSYIYNMALAFTHDNYPWETTFAVRQFLSNGDTNILYAGPMYVPNIYETWISEFMLPPGTFAFEIYDSALDGLLYPAWFMLNYTHANDMANTGSIVPTDLVFEDIWIGTFTLD